MVQGFENSLATGRLLEDRHTRNAEGCGSCPVRAPASFSTPSLILQHAHLQSPYAGILTPKGVSAPPEYACVYSPSAVKNSQRNQHPQGKPASWPVQEFRAQFIWEKNPRALDFRIKDAENVFRPCLTPYSEGLAVPSGSREPQSSSFSAPH